MIVEVNSVDDIEFLEKVAEDNGYEYNALKMIEECNELAAVLAQSLTRKDAVDSKAITDEIADVALRLVMLATHFDESLLSERIEEKLDKWKSWIESGKYSKI